MQPARFLGGPGSQLAEAFPTDSNGPIGNPRIPRQAARATEERGRTSTLFLRRMPGGAAELRFFFGR